MLRVSYVCTHENKRDRVRFAKALLGLNQIYFICNNTLTTEQLGHATSKITCISTGRINDVININFIDNKVNIGNCNKDDINMLARVYACVGVRVCVRARPPVCARAHKLSFKGTTTMTPNDLMRQTGSCRLRDVDASC